MAEAVNERPELGGSKAMDLLEAKDHYVGYEDYSYGEGY
jgi:hypothetical protein